MITLLTLAMLAAPVHAAPGDTRAEADFQQVYGWAVELASKDPVRVKAVFDDPRAPADVRLMAAALLLEEAPIGRPPEGEIVEDAVEEPASEVVTPSPLVAGAPTVNVPSGREDLACDQDGRVVKVMPVEGFATLDRLDVEVQGDMVLVRGHLDRSAGRPLHYLVEGGNAAYPSRYVVSMLGVKSGLETPVLPVTSELVRSVQVVERDGAIILVVNSSESRALRVDFDQRGDHFEIALRVARRPQG